MIKRLIFLMCLLSAPAFAAGPTYVSYLNWCYQGGLPTMVQGMKSTNFTQVSFPNCQVTVYVHGDGLATLFSDKSGTPLSNPFTASSIGLYTFYVDTTVATEYDITMTAGSPAPGFPAPVILPDVFIGGGGGGGGGGPGLCELQGTNPGDMCYFNGTNWLLVPGNATTQRFLSETSGVPSWQTANLLPSGTGVVRVNAGAGSAAELSGDVTTSGSNAVTVTKINGTALSGLTTGILKNTTGTGVPSIAASSDVIGLFTGCSGTQYLGADGACHTASSGSGTVNNCGTLGSIAYYAATGTVVSCVGSDFTFGTHSIVEGASGILDLHSGATSGFLLSGSFSTGFLLVTTTTGAVSSIATSGTKCYPYGGSGGTGCDNPTGGVGFSSLTSGTNSAAAMVVGTGASLATSGTGTIAATKVTTARYVTTFPAIATAQTWASMAPYAATFPANFTTPTSTVKCGTNPGGTVVFTLRNVTTSADIGTVSVSSSCVGTFATTGGTTQGVSEDDYLTVVSGTDATAVNVVIDWKATQ